ncbi:PREDICTED: uncharacterized protein LOC109588307 [Amphimedon queenslandica]|uniref:Death domain-containing protein n=1 Tax=Amphimedon queenslandica TaxID=400682 RepID=A0AAN0JSF6_AMPQE|nr:PREDICTED: uncharacterized protein LOC109588307 [Amphimedon queenslandica]|eukprot:XP_019860038.1 PREDICTED: uncharacterized protein LOC109588307 [Amphimedon queenslandica]
MSLKITFKGKEDTLHLINCYTHIEVYFTGPTQHCPLVRKLLTTAIDNSSDAMHLKHNYVNAFACPSKRSSCYCIVRSSGDGNIVNCTVCPVSATISSDHWYWFESGPAESNNGTQIKQDNDQPSDENLLLDKKPQKSDLVRLFKSSAAQYMLIGTALDVEVDDLLPNPQSTTKNLILVFNRWIDSDNDVTWRKVLQVCDDYPGQLGRVKAEVKEFLSSDRARGRSSQGQVVQLFEINFFMWMTM